MRKLIAWVFMYSLDGLLADEGTEYWQFCFGLPVDPADLKQKLGLYQSAYAHIMGRAAYEGMAGALPTADHPFTHHERRAQGRLLPDSEDGRVGQHHHRRW
jgi:dihydrofolate reductase